MVNLLCAERWLSARTGKITDPARGVQSLVPRLGGVWLALVAIVGGGMSPPALGAQAKPELGSAPFNGLKARVTAVRFFESGGNIPPSADRVITTRFDALTTRFINLELELDYPRAARPTAFQVDCGLAGPDGKVRPLTLSGAVEAGWTGSYHAGGAGTGERGSWVVGPYQVTCREEGQTVVRAQIEVVAPAVTVRALGGEVVQLRFYQSLADSLPVEARRYTDRFDGRSAGRIKTEFVLVYPPIRSPTEFSVECAYVFPDRSVRRIKVSRRLPAGWTGSAHVQGIALERWPPGTYTVSCWNNAAKMAERSFEVLAGPDDAGGNAGTARVFPLPADSGSAPAYGTSFELGPSGSLLVEVALPLRATGDSTGIGCLLTDPAGIASGFRLTGAPRDKDRTLVGIAPLPVDSSSLRGSYQLTCRAGAKAVATGGFALTGKADLAGLDLRVASSGLFAGGELPPDDEAVPDAVFAAARLQALWLVAILDHPSEQGVGAAAAACRVRGSRDQVVAESRPHAWPVPAGTRALWLRERVVPVAGRWAAGAYRLECSLGNAVVLRLPFQLTR